MKALTGTDPDRLPEEKARGITIVLGFAHLELSAMSGQPPSNFGSAGQPSVYHLGIVDVPGHEDFVKNMVAGVGSIDLALLVVAADDGWMPQTEEHLQILTYLGVTRAVVALTKIDLAQDEAIAEAGVRTKLSGTPFADAPIVRTSVVTNCGFNELKAALSRVLSDTPTQRDIGKPRLPIDRVFSLRGVGTVVTGTLTGGVLRRGQAVVIQPSGKKAHVRSVQSHGREVEASIPGTRTAVNLPELGVEEVRRGEVVTMEELDGPSQVLDVGMEISARGGRPLKDGVRVRIHHGSGNVAARVQLIQSQAGTPAPKELAVGQRTAARLWLEEPTFVFIGDQFIVRDWPEQRTLAGGVVVDTEPPKGKDGFNFQLFDRLRASCSTLNTQLTTAEVEPIVEAKLERNGVERRDTYLLQSRFSAKEIADGIDGAIKLGMLVLAGEFVVVARQWNEWRQKAGEAIEAHHRTYPERVGLALSDLSSALSLPAVSLLNALVADLCKSEFVQVGAVIRRVSHCPALPVALAAAGAKVRAALNAKPLDPPSRKEIAPDSASQQALRFLFDTGEAVDLGEDVVMLADAFGRATAIVRAELKKRGGATASELRQALGSSRRVTIPILERLDRDGVTRREGDKRVLRVG